jgi:hypothetical protein
LVHARGEELLQRRVVLKLFLHIFGFAIELQRALAKIVLTVSYRTLTHSHGILTDDKLFLFDPALLVPGLCPLLPRALFQ